MPEPPKPMEPKKPPPIILRQKFTEDLQKEIAPLIGGISPLLPSGFLTREQTQKLVAEKLVEQTKSRDQESLEDPVKTRPPGQAGSGNKASRGPDEMKSPMPSEESKNTEPVIAPLPSTPPNPAQKPEAPPPIKLEPLAARPATAPTVATLGTAKVPALDLRNAPKPPPVKTYGGFDPYKEPVE